MAEIPAVAGVFEVEVKARKLRNGHRIQIILEKSYEPDEYTVLSKYQFQRAKVSMIPHVEQQDLAGMDDDGTDDDGMEDDDYESSEDPLQDELTEGDLQ